MQGKRQSEKEAGGNTTNSETGCSFQLLSDSHRGRMCFRFDLTRVYHRMGKQQEGKPHREYHVWSNHRGCTTEGTPRRGKTTEGVPRMEQPQRVYHRGNTTNKENNRGCTMGGNTTKREHHGVYHKIGCTTTKGKTTGGVYHEIGCTTIKGNTTGVYHGGNTTKRENHGGCTTR